MILEEQFPVPRNTAVSKIGNGVIHCFDNSNVIATLIMPNYSSFFKGVFLWDDPDQDQWSKITWIMVDNESMNPCPEWIQLWRQFFQMLGFMARSFYSMILGGIDPEKLYWVKFICQYDLCCCIVWASFLFECFGKIWATSKNFWENGLSPLWQKIACMPIYEKK